MPPSRMTKKNRLRRIWKFRTRPSRLIRLRENQATNKTARWCGRLRMKLAITPPSRRRAMAPGNTAQSLSPLTSQTKLNPSLRCCTRDRMMFRFLLRSLRTTMTPIWDRGLPRSIPKEATSHLKWRPKDSAEVLKSPRNHGAQRTRASPKTSRN